MTKNELTTLVAVEVKGLDDFLDSVDYDNAADDAVREFDTSFPISGNTVTYWVKKRTKRHLFYYLMTEAAHKFRLEQINVNQRFDHYKSIIEFEDSEFEKFKEARPDLFANVEAYKLFGTKVDAGFSYDHVGRDATYDSDNDVDFNPKES